MAPDWLDIATDPAGGQAGAKVASRLTAGSVLTTPMQLGPTMRIPRPRTNRASSFWAAAPSDPVSAKPAEITTTALTPRSAHSDTVIGTTAAGTATTARSTGSAIAPRDATVSIPATSPPWGLTA